MARHVPDRWLVAFSLAGEQRELVGAIAEEVERQLGPSTVFYDEWFEHLIAGNDADLELQRIYMERSELVVICISGAYDVKPWTRAEHSAIRARYMEASRTGDAKRVLPVRVGPGEVEGIFPNAIVPDFTEREIAEAAQLVIDRLSLVSPAIALPNVTRLEWPEQLPDFAWPIADHTDAQIAFCALLMRNSPARLLLIEGFSETGKSILSNQMERYVADLLPDLRCGRFDFKGTADRSLEVTAFAQSLDLAVPEVQASGDQLMAALSQLPQLPRPTVVIFDTYEDAGDVQNLIERLFLTQLRKSEWLRVVVLGRQVPASEGTLWAAITAPTMKLSLPEPEAWYEYGLRYRSDADFDRNFVATAYELTGGKAATLAGLLGPQSGR
jgi:hypothetical protein